MKDRDRPWITAEELGADVLESTPTPTSAAPSDGPTPLSGEELQLLEAIAARIFPTTSTPGAAEAGAANYVNVALGGAYASSLPRYRRGLAELQRYCASTLGAPFPELEVAKQIETLRALQLGTITEVESSDDFFELVRRHVLEGVFCEPSYGGNRDLVGWAVVGFPGQRYGYADPYINKRLDLAPIAVDGPPRAEDS